MKVHSDLILEYDKDMFNDVFDILTFFSLKATITVRETENKCIELVLMNSGKTDKLRVMIVIEEFKQVFPYITIREEL